MLVDVWEFALVHLLAAPRQPDPSQASTGVGVWAWVWQLLAVPVAVCAQAPAPMNPALERPVCGGLGLVCECGCSVVGFVPPRLKT